MKKIKSYLFLIIILTISYLLLTNMKISKYPIIMDLNSINNSYLVEDISNIKIIQRISDESNDSFSVLFEYYDKNSNTKKEGIIIYVKRSGLFYNFHTYVFDLENKTPNYITIYDTVGSQHFIVYGNNKTNYSSLKLKNRCTEEFIVVEINYGSFIVYSKVEQEKRFFECQIDFDFID